MRTLTLASALLSTLALLGCVSSDKDELTPTEQQEQDIAEYEALQAELDLTRSEFLGERNSDLIAAGDKLYWLNFTNWDPTLHRWDETTDDQINYDLFISGDAWNYRVSDALIVTAREEGNEAVYTAYDADEPDVFLGELRIPAPADEQKWYAYAADGGDVYLMKTGSDQTRLERWTPGDDGTSLVTTMESTGLDISIMWEFGVDGDDMVVVESGRIWWVDLSANEATWLGNETEVRSWVEMSDAGVLFDTYDGLLFWDHATSSLRNLSEELETHAFQLNTTYASAHLYNDTAGFTLFGSTVVYVGNYGLFAYDMATDTVDPLLLNPRDLPRIDYRRPRILDSGLLFVTGLVSESGAVGADGPVYVVESDLLMR